jgi:hypothetical protein
MTIGIKKGVNSGKKIQNLILQFERTMKLILKEAGKPEFAASITQLKEEIKASDEKKNKLNQDARSVSKHLQTYPGLSRQVLTAIRAKIAEYRTLGVIEKYKVGPGK